MAKQLVQFVGRSEKTDHLYELEGKAAAALKRVAKELLGVKRSHGLKEYTLENAIAEELAVLAEVFSHPSRFTLEVHVIETPQEGCPALERVLP